MEIRINDKDYLQWLKISWQRQSDGYDRGYWYNPKSKEFFATCETKSTEHNPTGENICIGWVSGDNNAEYNSICTNCHNQDDSYLPPCHLWVTDYKYFDEFKDLQFDCMDNADWTLHFKNQMQISLNEKSINTGAEQVELIFE